jgi:hypothetical protein
MSVLNWKDKRQLLENSHLSPESLTDAGQELLRAGSPVDSADFFQKAAKTEKLRELKQLAVDEGDFFLYTKVRLALGEKPQINDLKSLAAKASQSGLYLYESKAQSLLEEISKGS